MNRSVEGPRKRVGSRRYVVDGGADRFDFHPARSRNARLFSVLEDFARNLQDAQGAGGSALAQVLGPINGTQLFGILTRDARAVGFWKNPTTLGSQDRQVGNLPHLIARSWNLRLFSVLEDFSRNLQDVQGAGGSALERPNGPKPHDFGYERGFIHGKDFGYKRELEMEEKSRTPVVRRPASIGAGSPGEIGHGGIPTSRARRCNGDGTATCELWENAQFNCFLTANAKSVKMQNHYLTNL